MKNSATVKENLVNLIAKIGEKISIRRTHFFDNSSGLNYFYVHSSLEKNIGKIISVVKLKGLKKGEDNEFGVKIAMHIAASNPLAIDKDGIDKKIVDKELEIIKAEILNSGKPSAIVEKILEGKMNKYFSEVTLLNQSFILDPDKNVKSIIEEQGKENKFKIQSFIFVSLS